MAMPPVSFEDDPILCEALVRYEIDPASLSFLGGFRNRVYEYGQNEQRYILRISSESQRLADMIRAEMDWMHYLAGRGLAVVDPLPSQRGNFVEVIEHEGRQVPVVAMHKAPGKHPGKEEWTPELFAAMGHFVGQMHQATREYTLAIATQRRPAWHEDLDVFAQEYLHAVDADIAAKFQAIRAYPKSLPQERDAYGLIHADFHRGNFHVLNGRITLFDFDDSQYSWFAEDLAMAVFYAVSPQAQSQEELDFARQFYQHFMEGYSPVYTLDAAWRQEIPYFLKQREINLYIVLTALKYELPEGSWSERFMQNRRQRILEDVPFVDIAF